MINNQLSIYFDGHNFMTPIIVGYFEINKDYIVEVSHSRQGEKSIFGDMTGITIMKRHDSKIVKKTNLSFPADGHLSIEEAKIAVKNKLKEESNANNQSASN